MIYFKVNIHYKSYEQKKIILFQFDSGQNETSDISHFATYQHFTSYFMGIITGYITITIDRVNLSNVIIKFIINYFYNSL